jgi:hypothetical protein
LDNFRQKGFNKLNAFICQATILRRYVPPATIAAFEQIPNVLPNEPDAKYLKALKVTAVDQP